MRFKYNNFTGHFNIVEWLESIFYQEDFFAIQAYLLKKVNIILVQNSSDNTKIWITQKFWIKIFNNINVVQSGRIFCYFIYRGNVHEKTM